MARERVRISLVPTAATQATDPRTDAYSRIQNGMAFKDGNGRTVVRKRPGTNYDTSAGSGNVVQLYLRESGSGFKVTDTRLEGLATTSALTGSPTYGSTPEYVYCAGEVGDPATDHEVVLVVAQDEGSYGETHKVSGANVVSAAWAGGPNGTPGSATDAIMHGCCVMDGYGFIIDEYAQIYNSNVDDLSTWTATDFIRMNYSATGKFVCHYNNHVVGMGGRSIEFFYNSGSTSGSPLLPRKDVVIMASPVGFCSDNKNVVAWTSADQNGEVGVYMLNGFRAEKISTFDIDKIIARMLRTNGTSSIRMSTLSHMGHNLIFVKLLDESATALVKVYDVQAGAWYEWTWGTSSVFFPYGVAMSQTSNDQYIAMGNGYVFILDPTTYQDDVSDVTTQNMTFSITTSLYRGLSDDSGAIKRASDFQLDAERNSNVTMAVSYSDDYGSTYSTAVNLSLTSPGTKLPPQGAFYERIYKLSSTDNYPIELHAINLVIDEGQM